MDIAGKSLTVAVVAVLWASLTACGSNGQAPEAGATTPESIGTTTTTLIQTAQPAETSTQPTLTLKETCPQVEAALPDSVAPGSKENKAATKKVKELREAGDQETKNALDILIPAMVEIEDPEDGQPFLDARAHLRSALGTVADRCKAVGSSALQ